ncbi:hypothetical protein B5X24_HaOG207888 [Helicoverpa armigera]|uniref:Uncharacterized protein n=1 Tax=Helicoverpa armigera TaxID=29058 RepID=A0A2W1BJC5_HELAM|nr:hypothetical protein B5X24_HaOG207888 [Helicoverpa armigera]
MLDVSSVTYPMAAIGDTVKVQVPEASNGRYMLAKVIALTANNLYKLGTEQGVLNQLYSRNQFTVCKERFMSPEDVPDAKKLCTSKCYDSASCSNK